MSEPPPPLSTSALAKALNKTTKQMFSELESLGWIERKEDSWQLTSKGEFEGGKYRESQKFGRYIIWPGCVVEHRVLASPDAHLVSSSQLAKHLSLSRKSTDQLLSELGWVQSGKKGWVLTPQGEKAGGHQRENPTTGVPFILWSGSILDNQLLSDRAIELQFSCEDSDLGCCDGHQVSNEAERIIDNWLYMNGLVHAYHRRIPVTEVLFSDFYLPQHRLYIEYWGELTPAHELAAKMRKREIFQIEKFSTIELSDSDINNLDEVLPRLLLKFDIET